MIAGYLRPAKYKGSFKRMQKRGEVEAFVVVIFCSLSEVADKGKRRGRILEKFGMLFAT